MYPSPLHYRIVPAMIYDINATIMFGTDTFLKGYGRAAHPYDFRSLRYIFAGAEQVHEETREQWFEKFGMRILEGYGATETAPVLAVNTADAPAPAPSAASCPASSGGSSRCPASTRAAGCGSRGPNMMLGYLRREARRARAAGGRLVRHRRHRQGRR